MQIEPFEIREHLIEYIKQSRMRFIEHKGEFGYENKFRAELQMLMQAALIDISYPDVSTNNYVLNEIGESFGFKRPAHNYSKER